MMKRLKMLVASVLLLSNLLVCASCVGNSSKGNGESENGSVSESNTDTENKTEVIMGVTPEKYGISSEDITKVIEGLEKEGLSMHSVLVMRHGEVIAECYAAPFDENSLHRMYSTSKSFVAMAIGALEAEGKISLNDTIDEYFPDFVDKDTDERITNAKIVDLLRMMSPYIKVDSCGDGQEDWVDAFFNGTPDKQPGTSFNYDTGATHILGVIVERVTGKDFLEYLKEKALLEIGFSENAWCVKAPEGYAWGGSGVMCTSRDLAAFANLVMNKGEYNGKQLLPREYVEAATSKQVETAAAEGNSPYYGMGYGYQIWMNPYGFAFMGMGNQNAFCVPDKDLVIVCTADNQGNGEANDIIYSLFEEHIIKKVSDEPLPENPEAFEKMNKALENIEIPCVKGKTTSSLLTDVHGKTFEATDDGAKISSFRLDFDGEEGTLTYDTPRGKKTLRFGIGKNVECVLDEPQYYGETIGTPNGKGYRSYCSGAWRTDKIFVIKVQVVDDYVGNMSLMFNFSGASPTLNGTKTAEWFLNEYKITDEAYEVK